jgi:hypothetical protein
MPLEIIFPIIERLEIHEKLVLSQTCTAMRNILYDGSQQRKCDLLSDVERLEYLTCLARENMEVWVCKSCIKLHRVCYDDVPGKATGGLVKRCDEFGLIAVSSMPLSPLPFESTTLYFHYCHIQLALKYTRMVNRRSFIQKYYLR